MAGLAEAVEVEVSLEAGLAAGLGAGEAELASGVAFDAQIVGVQVVDGAVLLEVALETERTTRVLVEVVVILAADALVRSLAGTGLARVVARLARHGVGVVEEVDGAVGVAGVLQEVQSRPALHALVGVGRGAVLAGGVAVDAGSAVFVDAELASSTRHARRAVEVRFHQVAREAVGAGRAVARRAGNVALHAGLCGLVGELVVAAEDTLVCGRFEVRTLVLARQTVELGLSGTLCAREVAVLAELSLWVAELRGCTGDALHRGNLEVLDTSAARQTRSRKARVACQTGRFASCAFLAEGVAPCAVSALYALCVCVCHLEVGGVATRLAFFRRWPATRATVCVAFHTHLIGLVTEFAELAGRARCHQRVEVRNHFVAG